MTGDSHWPHHVEGSGGAILLATFILAMAGLLLVIARRWRDPWWRFVLYGLAVSIVPGAITDWPFHQARLMGYAVFLLVLTVPALEWMLAPADPKHRVVDRTDTTRHGEPGESSPTFLAMARRAQFGWVFLRSYSQRPLRKLSISKSVSGVRDESDTLPSTFCISHSMTQQSHGQSGQSIWRTANGVPLIWMRIGTLLWKTGLPLSLFGFPMA